MDIVHKFPNDIVDYIYSLIKYEQPKELVNNIKNIHIFKIIYHDVHERLYQDEGSDEVQNWMINNLEIFIELYNNTSVCENYLYRIYGTNTRKIERQKEILKKSSNISKNINFIIGLLTVEERKHLILKSKLFKWLTDEEKNLLFN